MKNSTKEQLILKGKGTKNNPFLIVNLNDLLSMKSSKYIDKNYYFKQINDLYINRGIFSEKKIFSGNYNGNNKKIVNSYEPIFYKIINSTIENVILESLKIKQNNVSNDKKDYIYDEFENIKIKNKACGGIASYSENSYINNCSVSGEIFYTNFSSNFPLTLECGGIIGQNIGGKISDCSVYVTLHSTSDCRILEEHIIYSISYCGGIAGSNNKGNISNCKIYADLSSVSDCGTSNENIDYTISYCGGVVGANYEGNINNCIVESYLFSKSDCQNISYYVNSDSYCGGIIGYNSLGNIKDCKFNGKISIQSQISRNISTTLAGGIIGNNIRGNIIHCEVNGIISFIPNSLIKEYYDEYNLCSRRGGGIVGENIGNINNSVANVEIVYQFNFTNIVEEAELYCGGAVGFHSQGSINNSFVNSNIIFKNNKNYIETYFNKMIGISSDINVEIKNNIFKKRYIQKKEISAHKFYIDLGWDFEKIWKWNKEKKQPILKSLS